MERSLYKAPCPGTMSGTTEKLRILASLGFEKVQGGYLILGLGSQNRKVGYPKKGVWYEPTGVWVVVEIRVTCWVLETDQD